jgi:hypothetical protein
VEQEREADGDLQFVPRAGVDGDGGKGEVSLRH